MLVHVRCHLHSEVSQVKSALFSILPHVQYIQRIEISLLSDPWCIQLTLNTDSRRSNTDKYSLNHMYIQTIQIYK